MIQRPHQTALRPRTWFPLIAALVLLSAQRPASAGLVFTSQNVTVAAGTNNASLDVFLTNTGTKPVTIGGFGFELTVGGSAITLTDVTTSTSAFPYIFGNQGFGGPSIGSVVSGQDIMATDLYTVIGSGATLASGGSLGLGHVLFNVSAAAQSGATAVHFLGFPSSSLSDASFNDVPITALNDGSITVTSSTAVPEPASIGLFCSGLTLSAFLRFGRGRRRR